MSFFKPPDLKSIIDNHRLSLTERIIYSLLNLLCRTLSLTAPSKKVIIPGKIKKILIFSTTGIGNVLFFIPGFKQLRRIYPNAEILVLAPHITRPIYESANFGIDGFLAREEYQGIKGSYQLIRLIRRHQFDMSIRLYPLAGFGATIVTALSNIPIRIGHRSHLEPSQLDLSYVFTHIVEDQPQKHDIEHNLDLIVPLRESSHPTEVDFRIQVEPDDEKKAGELLMHYQLDQYTPLIGFHFGCDHRSRYKMWPLENFVELITQLNKIYHIMPILFWGPAEADLIDVVANQLPIAFKIPVILPILETTAIIQKMDGFISTDSALMHIATGVGVPTVGIFGPTSSVRTRPYGNLTHVIRLGLECSPCHDRYIPNVCRKAAPLCLTRLSVDQVLNEIETFWQDNVFAPAVST